MKQISSVELRTKLAEVINEVKYAKETYAITRRGEIVAYVSFPELTFKDEQE